MSQVSDFVLSQPKRVRQRLIEIIGHIHQPSMKPEGKPTAPLRGSRLEVHLHMHHPAFWERQLRELKQPAWADARVRLKGRRHGSRITDSIRKAILWQGCEAEEFQVSGSKSPHPLVSQSPGLKVSPSSTLPRPHIHPAGDSGGDLDLDTAASGAAGGVVHGEVKGLRAAALRGHHGAQRHG